MYKGISLEEVVASLSRKRGNLRFSANVERYFREQQTGAMTPSTLAVLSLSLVVYNIFYFIDLLMLPDTAVVAAFLHIGVTICGAAAQMCLRKYPGFACRQLTCVIMPIAMLAQILAIYAMARSQLPAGDYRYLGALVVIFMNINLRPDFWIALLASAILNCLYAATLILVEPTACAVAIAIMIAASALTLIANARMEVVTRHAFIRRLQERLLRQTAEAEASLDALTGLKNRRHFFLRATELWSRVAPQEQMALIMIDIDHFKRFNDLYGHPKGDECLQRVAEVIRRFVRNEEDDVAARLGGEEFVLLLSRTEGSRATGIADELRRQVAGCRMLPDGSGKVTASVGVAAGASASWILQELIEQADAALYGAKRAGRNCVRSAVLDRAAA